MDDNASGPTSDTAMPPSGRGFLASHPLLVDVLIAVAYLVLLLPGLTHQLVFGTMPLGVRLLALVATLLIGATLIFRRRAPSLVLVAVFVLVMVKTLSGFVDPLGLALASYAAAAYAPARRVWMLLSAIAGGTVAVTVLGRSIADEPSMSPGTDLILLLSSFVPAVLIGFLVRVWSTLRESERQRFVQSVHERAQAEEIMAVRERTALSREMHDIIGHSLTAIINLSDGALRAVTVSPELMEEGMRRINTIARDALGETRGVLGELRTDGETAPRKPSPLHDQFGPKTTDLSDARSADLGVGSLLETARSTGLAAHLSVIGDSTLVSEDARAAVYRIVQEAITNVMRHAKGATQITVTLTYAANTFTAQIHDNGTTSDASSAGSGLQGAAERVALLDGSLHYGPAPTGGWHVTASIPRKGGVQV